MTCTRADEWSLRRSLAFLVAIFALFLGALMPSGVAANPSGGGLVLCVAQPSPSGDPLTKPGPSDDAGGPMCPACLAPTAAVLSPDAPSAARIGSALRVEPAPAAAPPAPVLADAAAPPPSRAPPAA